MKNAKREMKRKGFTLVELLIVIVVIGVLSAMMMLSSTEAVSSAKAADIVSDLRNLKTAALAWYADNLSAADALAAGKLNDKRDDILKYMGTGKADSAYKFYNADNAKGWYVGYDGLTNNTSVQGKLAGRAASTGLLKSQTSNDTYVSGNTTVYMFIR